MPKPSYGPEAKERTKRLLEAMLAYANQELENADHLQIEANWQTENKLVVRTKVRFLEELTAKYQKDGKLDNEQIREALKRLKDWLEILEDNRTKTQGAEDWHFTLKLWSKDKQENLKRFELEWESRKAKKSKPTETKAPSKTKAGIDWRQVCRAMLETQNQGRLTTNPLTTGDGVGFELDEIYVPLGLVERKQQDRRSSDVSPERGSKLYESEQASEVTRTFQHDEFFEQVLRLGRSKRIAIIGEPGAGKTTLLQKIAAWVLDNTSDVPIWISLADLQEKTLEAYLLQDWLKAATRKVRVTQVMEEALGELFNSGRVWLLLDGVDEMTVGGLPLQAIANQLISWVSDARVVLTCRLNVWDAGKNALEAFETYRNLDFSYGDAQTPDLVGQFIRRWFSCGAIHESPHKGDRLRAELDKPGRERIKDAVKNPLRLALLCRTWALGQGGLPSTKAGQYLQFTSALYEWKQDRFPTTSTQRQKLNKALGELALRAISEEKTKFRLRHRLVSSVLRKPDADLFELALQLGFLNQVGVAAEAENRGEKVYAFYHPTFQEYFAAQAVSDWHYFLNHTPRNPAKGTYRIFESQWKEVILLWLGREDVHHRQKEDFITALVDFKDGCADANFYAERAYFLAAAGIAEFADCSCADKIVAEIIKSGFGYFNIEKQEWQTFLYPRAERARAALQETDRRKASAALVQLIKSTEDESIRRLSAESLGEIDTGNQTAVAALVQLIESTKKESTCRQAAESLGKIGNDNQTAVAALVQLIESTKNEYTCWQATKILGQIGTGNETAIAALVQLVESTKNEYTQWQAAESLGKIDSGNETAIAALVQIIKSTKNEYTRRQAADSLRQIDSGNAIAIATLIKLISQTEDEDTRRQAAESLGEIDSGNERAIATLAQLISSSEDESTRRRAAYSLGKVGTGNQTAIAALVQLISSTKDEDTRRAAVDSLGKIGTGNPEAVAALVQLISSTEDEQTLWKAVYRLGEIGAGHPEAVAILVQLISSTGDEDTRRQAAESLGEIGAGHPEVVAVLVQLISSTEDEHTRRQAAESLGKIDPGNQTAIAVLVQLIESAKDESILWLATESLGAVGIGNQTAIAALVKLISSTQDEYTLRRTAESLKKILLNEQLALVVTALKDYLSDETKENKFERFRECYEVIWHCAQNLPYPAFYQAWHTQPTLQEDKQGSASHAFTTLRLRSAIANDPQLSQTIHLICIDGSKFIDPDNPAAEIYIEMVEQGCAERQQGEPTTMQALKIYWKQLKSNKRVVLVFYENLTGYQPQGLSHSFLTALSKFDGAIAVVTSPPTPLLGGEGSHSYSPSSASGEGVGGWGCLQYFAASQPMLLEDMLGWIAANACGKPL